MSTTEVRVDTHAGADGTGGEEWQPFRSLLLDHRLLVSTGVDGLYGRSTDWCSRWAPIRTPSRCASLR
jgi:hypothetical protein